MGRVGEDRAIVRLEPSNRDGSTTIALLTDALEELLLADVAAWCAERDITGVELGVGGYSPAPHADRAALLASEPEREALLAQLARHGVALVALNASGNPLSPDAQVRAEHDAALRDAIRLAALLGTETVVAMSGCPGGPGQSGGRPVFAGGAWLPDMEGLWEHQWETIAPYWSALSRWAEQEAPGVDICLELHPGTSIYNAPSYLLLREVTGANVKINLDPSHFWWQGIDPIATIDAVGDEAVGFVHGKDTKIHPDRVSTRGLLDFAWPAGPDEMAWHFCAVGHGRPADEWRALLERLREGGYHGPISIEHEDPELGAAEGIECSLAGLVAAGVGEA